MTPRVFLRQRPCWQRRARIPLVFWRHYRLLRHPKGLDEVDGLPWWTAARIAWSMAMLLWPQRQATTTPKDIASAQDKARFFQERD